MAQLSISFGIEFNNLPVNQPVDIKVSHRTRIVVKDEDLDWGDIYDDYEDFDVCSTSWK